MRTRRFLARTLALAALSLHMGCSREESAPLRIGINSWPPFEFLYLAQEKGFYRAEGVEVRVVEFNSSSDMRRAYERGQIDGMTSTVTELLQVRDSSPRAPQVVQVIDYSDGADKILARPGINTCADLRGARVGVEVAALGIYILARALEQSGLSLADVELVPLDQVGLEAAMRRGEVDAVVTFPPTSSKMLRDVKATSIFSTAEIPGEVADVLALDAEVNARRPDDVRKLLRGYHRAVAYRQRHPEEAHRIMAEREQITPEEFTTALQDGVRLVSASEQSAYLRADGKLGPTIATADRILRRIGQVKGPDRTADLLNASFARKETAR